MPCTICIFLSLKEYCTEKRLCIAEFEGKLLLLPLKHHIVVFVKLLFDVFKRCSHFLLPVLYLPNNPHSFATVLCLLE